MKTCALCGRKKELNSDGFCLDCSGKMNPEPIKTYHSRTDAPMNFHYFNRNFAIPVGILSLLARFILEFTDIQFFYWLYIIDLLYYVAVLSLLVTTLVGFIKWRLFGYTCFRAYLIVQLSYSLFCVLLYAFLNMTTEAGEAAFSVLCLLIYAVIVFIYYKKRKPLFEQKYTVPDTADGTGKRAESKGLQS